jgi:hypothetical protein
MALVSRVRRLFGVGRDAGQGITGNALADAERIVIPSVRLKGTREAKLAQLDSLLVQLHIVRHALGGDTLSSGTMRAPGERGERERNES